MKIPLPNKEEKLYGLDHLRALAILLVLGFHYLLPVFGHPAWLTKTTKFGWTGVDLFFVLSGFLISSQLFSQLKKGTPISLKTFFIKRFFRIIPVYLAIVGIYFCWPFFREKEALPALWRFLTFTQNFGQNINETGTFSHAWSLCVEEHFYLLLPVILILLLRINRFKKSYWLLIVLFLFGFVCRLLSWYGLYIPAIESGSTASSWVMYIYYPTYNRLDGLLVGVSIAAVYQYAPGLWEKIAGYGNYWIGISLTVLTGAWFVCANPSSFNASIFGFPLVALGYGLLVLGAICPSSFLYQWNSKATTQLATLSYAIYLSHKGVIHLVQHYFSIAGIDKNSNGMMLISFVFCILAAFLLHLTVEKPFMKMRDKVLGQKITSSTSLSLQPLEQGKETADARI